MDDGTKRSKPGEKLYSPKHSESWDIEHTLGNETLEAIKELESGKGERLKSLDDLFNPGEDK